VGSCQLHRSPEIAPVRFPIGYPLRFSEANRDHALGESESPFRSLSHAIRRVGEAWLLPAEFSVRLLVEEVRYHAKDGEIEITFRPGGIRAMAAQEAE